MTAKPSPPAGAPRRRVLIQPPGRPAEMAGLVAPVAPVALADPGAGLRQLLAVEQGFRRADSRSALAIALANESARLCRARQVFVLGPGLRGALAVESVSGLAVIEARAPRLRWIEACVAALPADDAGAARPLPLGPPDDPEAAAFPFREAVWVPFDNGGTRRTGGVLLTRETPWEEADTALAVRLAETAAHALRALRAERRRLPAVGVKTAAGGAAALLCALACPVSLTVLAPATVSAERPFVVAAPIDGIVEEVTVAPNAPVAPGDTIVRFVDTVQRNTLAVAERDVEVAEARLRQLTQGAYTDDKARRELGQARAELALKAAERDFARATLGRTTVRAERAGVAVYADRKDWSGKPVTTGQRILEIADPALVELRIDLPVADAIALPPDARVRLFLDADPLDPAEAVVAQVTPVARVTEAGVLAHRVVARFAAGGGAAPRLGARGTAQLYGPRVPLGFYLLRRPITWLRQRIGF